MSDYAKVLITGGSGRLGGYVVEALGGRCEVTVFDQKAPAADVRFIEGDVLDLGALTDAARGHDAVIHLAALLPSLGASGDDIFRTNLLGSWNALEAAYEARVGRFLLCSSECTVGLCFQETPVPPDYLPVDEAHPLRPIDPYSLSKQLAEEAGLSFARRGRFPVIAIRPTLILFPEQADEVRARSGVDDPDLSAYVEGEDVAWAFARALDLDMGERIFDVFFIGAADTLSALPTLELMARRFGRVPEVRRPELYERNPHASVYDIAHARDVLGYEPTSDWRRLVAQ